MRDTEEKQEVTQKKNVSNFNTTIKEESGWRLFFCAAVVSFAFVILQCVK